MDELLAARLGVPLLSVRDAAQAAVRDGSDLGAELLWYLRSGRLPPDNVLATLVRRRLTAPDTASGFVYRGHPGPPPVLRMLETLGVRPVELALPETEAIRRLTGRRTCRGCAGIGYVEPTSPPAEQRCVRCGGELFRRPDDEPAVVAERLATYRRDADPVLTDYRARGLLVSVDARQPVEDVVAEVLRSFDW